VIWQRGDQEGAFRHFDRAAALAGPVPTSLQKGWVLSGLARFHALAGHNRDAGLLAEQAIAVAEELADDELLGEALNNRGIVRSQLGHPGWRDDLERSLALAVERKSWRAHRAYLNLSATLVANAAEMGRSLALLRDGLGLVAGRGSGLQERWFRANLAEVTFLVGLWDEALDLAEHELANPEPHYVQQMCGEVRAYIRLARGDYAGAAADSEAVLAGARAIKDPQALIPGLSERAFLLSRMGHTSEAEALLAELADARTELRADVGGHWVVDLAFAFLELGRQDEAEPTQLGPETPWRRVAEDIIRTDLASAADALAAIGAVTHEAHARLSAAGQLVDARHRGEAERQLGLALAFYRSVRATAFMREAESLLAAAG
jgi:hypothetical protein